MNSITAKTLFRPAVAAATRALMRPTIAAPIMARTGVATARTLATVVTDRPLMQNPPKNQPEPPTLPALFRLKSGQTFQAKSFGAPLTGAPISGEAVFTTSLVGYPESMTDPSYRGQILVFTQPLIGNYGVPSAARDEWGLLKHFEAEGIQVKAIIVNDYAFKYSHWNAIESLGQWCARNGVPALTGIDTRAVAVALRSEGSMLAEIRIGDAQVNAPEAPMEDPNARNLIAEVSTKTKVTYNKGGDVKIALIDCGVKHNIIRCLVSRGAEVDVVPWDHDLVNDPTAYDGIFISNGPGNPAMAAKTVENLRAYMQTQQPESPVPIFGICMGNQLLGMAAGLKTYKLPFGNRGHNQPALNLDTGKCVITSQNHGYALDDKVALKDWVTYFRNANDGSNEGIRHVKLPFKSVQFHPEAMGGPQDTEYLFQDYLTEVREYKVIRAKASQGATLEQPLQAAASA
ncbi:Multifunctional pyrimidine synthesis protein CAD [Rhizophlyctis rosea]|uniref:Carbamoyl phosphate synthase arginine-specific small chain n=1 Tax=Rhizophlyctis rosea TaxID=64517 RepID=A0AAD5SG31_9FUNG|nr:Multifunctional pyrimidine synthesis protein CAD [Rhizophlyctis rosea]